MAERTFGWFQDAADITKLRRLIEIFDPQSTTHQDLINTRIPKIVSDIVDQQRFLALLKQHPISIPYRDLTGHALGGARANDPCNGIIQATLEGQRRPYMSDWSADNFLKWAHCLGFLKYDPMNDSFILHSKGLAYLQTPMDGQGTNRVLEEAFLAYPPLTRLLRLLSKGQHLTKFEIGSELGFVGENGFTTLPQPLLVRELALTSDKSERAKMLTNWEGTSDKYARMIAGWCQKVGWIEQSTKELTVVMGKQTYTADIPQSYLITKKGVDALRRSEGGSSHPQIAKNIFFEMLATKGNDRKLLRLRRATLLKALNGTSKTLTQLCAYLQQKGITADFGSVHDDIRGLTRIGLRIDEIKKDTYQLRDKIDFTKLHIPAFTHQDTLSSDILTLKDTIRQQLTQIDHKYLVLIDISFDGQQDRLFEMQTMQLMQECGYMVAPSIGGSNRPDGVAFTQGLAQDYGLIIDAKAYGKGFSCSAGQRNQMQNYLLENLQRPTVHRSSWWQDFPPQLKAPQDFRFLFVSSRFTGQFRQQFQQLSQSVQHTLGAGITAANLLLFAEAILTQTHTLSEGHTLFGTLDEVIL